MKKTEETRIMQDYKRYKSTQEELLSPVDEAKWRIQMAKEKGRTYLSLDYLSLGVLPDELWGLTSLDLLILRGNSIKELPPEIGKLTNLTYLDLSCNELKSLPKELWGMIGLTHLDLCQNCFEKLPPEIGQLVNLTALFLGKNELTELPIEITDLTLLSDFWIEGNPLPFIDGEQFGMRCNILQLGEFTVIGDKIKPNGLLLGDNEVLERLIVRYRGVADQKITKMVKELL